MARFLYPDDSARKTFNRGKFVLRSLLYRAQCADLAADGLQVIHLFGISG